MHRWRGVHIGKHCHIAQQCSIDNAYPELVFIEDGAGVNQGTTIIAHTNAGAQFEDIVPNIAAPVVIRHHALCAINTTILPGVEIGEYSIVTAGSVVNRSMPAYSLVIGNPAKTIHNYERIVRRNIRNMNKEKESK
jgi:acetyltransferase-like isoleucine patch superfamily enzyme